MTLSNILNELLSTSTEVHAAVYGIYAGITEWKGTELPDDAEVRDEPQYFRGGYICGTTVRWVAILLIGSNFI